MHTLALPKAVSYMELGPQWPLALYELARLIKKNGLRETKFCPPPPLFFYTFAHESGRDAHWRDREARRERGQRDRDQQSEGKRLTGTMGGWWV